jgi:hypothetical protein
MSELSASAVERHAHQLMSLYSTKIPEKLEKKINEAKGRIKKR